MTSGPTAPAAGRILAGHTVPPARAGIAIFGNLALEQLAATGVRELVSISLPLKLAGAAGSPARPVALITEEKE